MTSKFEIRGTFGLEKRTRKLLSELRSVADELGKEAVKNTVERTKGGRDIKGAPFKGYTEPYKRYRRRRGKPTHPVDLYLTGEMLRSIKHKVAVQGDKYRISVGVTGAKNQRKASGLQTRPGKERKFLGVTQKMKIEIEKRLRQVIARILRGR